MAKKRVLDTKQLTIIALLLAMMIIFAFVPINIAGLSLAILPLIAIFIACQVEGGKVGFFMGFAFGILSLISAIAIPTVLSPIFYNPMVSIIPRLFIGITCYFSYKGMNKLLKNAFKNKRTIVKNRLTILLSSSVSSAVGTITNTVLVVAMIYAFNAGKNYGGLVIDANFLSALIGINFVSEILFAILITPPITLALRMALHKVVDNKYEEIIVSSISNEQKDKDDSEINCDNEVINDNQSQQNLQEADNALNETDIEKDGK